MRPCTSVSVLVMVMSCHTHVAIGWEPVNVREFERHAQLMLSKNAFDYYASGANDMVTLRENRLGSRGTEQGTVLQLCTHRSCQRRRRHGALAVLFLCGEFRLVDHNYSVFGVALSLFLTPIVVVMLIGRVPKQSWWVF